MTEQAAEKAGFEVDRCSGKPVRVYRTGQGNTLAGCYLVAELAPLGPAGRCVALSAREAAVPGLAEALEAAGLEVRTPSGVRRRR